jgi:hypothetical protein
MNEHALRHPKYQRRGRRVPFQGALLQEKRESSCKPFRKTKIARTDKQKNS